ASTLFSTTQDQEHFALRIAARAAHMIAIIESLLRILRRQQDVRINASATHATRSARLAVVDPDWRRQLTGPPFRAPQSSRNGPVRLGQRFSEARLRALLAEGGDAMQLRPPPAAQPLPAERTHLRTPTRLEP